MMVVTTKTIYLASELQALSEKLRYFHNIPAAKKKVVFGLSKDKIAIFHRVTDPSSGGQFQKRSFILYSDSELITFFYQEQIIAPIMFIDTIKGFD